MTKKTTITLTADQLDSLPEVILWDIAKAARLLRDAETDDVVWYDDEGEPWTLTGHALTVGGRVLLWTSCDEAGEDDREVVDLSEASLEEMAREHAEEVARGLGSLKQPVPDCTEREHDWQAHNSGCVENPGVHGHGGGVMIKTVCAHCDLTRTVDTWADDGRGGHCERTSYTKGTP